MGDNTLGYDFRYIGRYTGTWWIDQFYFYVQMNLTVTWKLRVIHEWSYSYEKLWTTWDAHYCIEDFILIVDD